MFPTSPEPLVVTFLLPKNGSRWFQESMSASFSLKIPTLGVVNSITYLIDGSKIDNVNSVITAKEGERFVGFFDLVKYSAKLDLSTLTDGWHTITVVATGTSPYDPEGGMNAIHAEVQGSGSSQFLYEVAAPTITVLIQQNQTYVDNDVQLNFVLSEKADWIGYILDEQTPVTITGNTTLTGLIEGMHSLIVYANDTLGRKGNSEKVFFIVEQEIGGVPDELPKSEPPPALVVAAPVSITAVSAGVLVYWKKRKR
jgi:hypothetical protein